MWWSHGVIYVLAVWGKAFRVLGGPPGNPPHHTTACVTLSDSTMWRTESCLFPPDDTVTTFQRSQGSQGLRSNMFFWKETQFRVSFTVIYLHFCTSESFRGVMFFCRKAKRKLQVFKTLAGPSTRVRFESTWQIKLTHPQPWLTQKEQGQADELSLYLQDSCFLLAQSFPIKTPSCPFST